MKLLSILSVALFTLASMHAAGQQQPTGTGLDPAALLHPMPDSWPTYNGDYSGRRFSTLTQINDKNVKALSLAWLYQLPNVGEGVVRRLAGTPIVVNGVIYITVPDHVWAIDARSSQTLWHYGWTSKGGIHLGNRGVGISGNSLYFETPDCNLVALNIADGKKLWSQSICDLDQMYYASVAPLVVKNHVITGVSGDDLDRPGFLEAHDPETGALQWRWSVVPKPGEFGSETWPNADAMAHGGGMTWISPTYDPELNLLYIGTGNPQPVLAASKREGANLYTESIVALHADTGEMAWYFQPSPHDTHDWDAVQTPVLFDGEMEGKSRKLLAQASRNGWFFVLDRETGKNYVSSEFVKTNWTKGLDAKGQPIPNPSKEPQIPGVLVTPDASGGVNWEPPTFSPATGLFYVNATHSYSMFYIYDDSDKPEGWGGQQNGHWSQSMLQAMDYRTGKIKWSHTWETPGNKGGLLSTAGNLVFAGDPNNNLVALDATTGKLLWHANLSTGMSNGPITYEVDGRQYLLVGAGDKLFSFVMN
ncbi:acido-empty-quinoprotein group A [Edaphobacter flagellatus]|uniref:acido-empty-quinoprotein group A n=1 Tax=Edaphobacter flagellatus TaxID=1933044 RepID=UPI0021B1A4C9|nr:acido-empty-quinoprotein group A [Edaphobacter flagellatus]